MIKLIPYIIMMNLNLNNIMISNKNKNNISSNKKEYIKYTLKDMIT